MICIFSWSVLIITFGYGIFTGYLLCEWLNERKR